MVLEILWYHWTQRESSRSGRILAIEQKHLLAKTFIDHSPRCFVQEIPNSISRTLSGVPKLS